MKYIYTLTTAVVFIIIVSSFFSFTKPYSSSAPPQGYTGASVSYCTSCHNSFAINSVGGNVATIGLPTSVTLGAVYNFSTIITHSAADREKFGFAIKAVDANGTAVGVFSTSNPNAGVASNEIGHRNAPATLQPEMSYTYDNLVWTAPTVSPTYPITFYIVGNAGNNGQGSAGDYIYSATVVANAAVVPVTLSRFDAKQIKNADVNIQWRTEQEINTEKFEIEKSTNGQRFTHLLTTAAHGFSNSTRDYTITDKNPTTTGEYIYYRLKIIDRDGTFKYSSTAKVLLIANETIIKNIATISHQTNNSFEVNILSANSQNIKINWVNSNGQIISTEHRNLVKGSNNFVLQNRKIAKGEVIFLNFETSTLHKSYSLVN